MSRTAILPPSVHTDWPKLIEEVQWQLGEPHETIEHHRTPMPIERMAERLGVPRGTLRGWIDGSEPKHADGERLIDLWCRLLGKTREFVPTERRSLSAPSR